MVVVSCFRRPFKGDLLVGFFSGVGWRPKRVVFFDDKEFNLYDFYDAVSKVDADI